MKMVQAIIEPFKLDAVKDALDKFVATGLTINEVKGIARQGQTEIYRGAEYQVDLIARMKIELVVSNEMVDRVVEAILSAARTGRLGDTKIFVLPVEEAISVRTGERGESAA